MKYFVIENKEPQRNQFCMILSTSSGTTAMRSTSAAITVILIFSQLYNAAIASFF